MKLLGELYAEEEKVPGQREKVVSALGSIWNPSAAPGLASLLNRTEVPDLALASALSLAKIGTPDAVGFLVEAIEDPPEARADARRGLDDRLSCVCNP